MKIYIVWDIYHGQVAKVYNTKQLAEKFLALHPKADGQVVSYTVETSLHGKRIEKLDKERAQLLEEENGESNAAV